MEITLEQLYEMQKELDARIIKDKGLEGQDLLPNTVLALQVEIGELANEWRGFKHWSNDREPRYNVLLIDPNGDCGDEEMTHPLLEEFVDCVHFFLSIARQKEWLEHLYLHEEAIEETRENGLDGGTGGAILEVVYWLSKFHMEKATIPKIEDAFGYSTEVFYFRNAWYVFMAIGLVGFGFTFDQIAAAYMEKNKKNHERQANGY